MKLQRPEAFKKSAKRCTTFQMVFYFAFGRQFLHFGFLLGDMNQLRVLNFNATKLSLNLKVDISDRFYTIKLVINF
jgi:hypothetical protein